MSHSCFTKGCKLEVKYTCLCSSSETHSCELHLEIHLKLPNRIHNFDSIIVESTEGTKDEVLGFYTKEKPKEEKLKEIISDLNNSKNNVEDTSIRMDFDMDEISYLIKKNSQNLNEDKLLNPEVRQHDNFIQPVSIVESYFSTWTIYDKWAELRSKRREILNSAKNDPEIEQNFRQTSSLYQNQWYASNLLLNKAFQEYVNSYHQLTSLYLIGKVDNIINFFIYDTESESEEVKLINIPPKMQLPEDDNRFLKTAWFVQLPNGELFCDYKENSASYSSFIMDRNYNVRILRSKAPLRLSSAIYFNRSLYCFGDYCSISQRLDLDENKWFELTPIPIYGKTGSSALFKRNILISSLLYNTLVLYSIDINSFSIIPYEFSSEGWKILMSTNERLYLIDCFNGFIYESEDQFIWQQIATSNIRNNYSQIYCSCNKGGVYISTIDYDSIREYYKFDLNQKTLIEIGYYHENIALRRVNDKLEAIEGHGQKFNFGYHNSNVYSLKKYSLYDLGRKLEKLERYNIKIKNHPSSPHFYFKRGCLLEKLEKYLSAIKCYNVSIMLNPMLYNFYLKKGHALNKLGRKIEEIECYNKVIKLLPRNPYAYFFKGNALFDSGRKDEARKCYNESIKLKILKDWIRTFINDIENFGPKIYDWKNTEIERCFRNLDIYYNNERYSLSELERNIKEIMRFGHYSNSSIHYINEGIIFYGLNQNLEAIECYNEAIRLFPKSSSSYFNKAKALEKLGRQDEALECYNKAINIYPYMQIYFCYRACLLIDLGRKIEAENDFKSAWSLMALKADDTTKFILNSLKSVYYLQKALKENDNHIYQDEEEEEKKGKKGKKGKKEKEKEEENQDCLKYLHELCTIAKITIIFKDEQPKFKDFILKIPEKIKELRKRVNF